MVAQLFDINAELIEIVDTIVFPYVQNLLNEALLNHAIPNLDGNYVLAVAAGVKNTVDGIRVVVSVGINPQTAELLQNGVSQDSDNLEEALEDLILTHRDNKGWYVAVPLIDLSGATYYFETFYGNDYRTYWREQEAEETAYYCAEKKALWWGCNVSDLEPCVTALQCVRLIALLNLEDQVVGWDRGAGIPCPDCNEQMGALNITQI